MSKKLIKKILREQIDNENKSYDLFKNIIYKKFDEYVIWPAQIFIDASRKDYYLSSGKLIETGEECFNQPYCQCQYLKDQIDWSEDMLRDTSFIKSLDIDFYDEKQKDEPIFTLPPYNLMQYGFTGYESMYFHNRLFRELREKYKC